MIIEFAGLPRSGKTTIAELVADYFRRTGVETRLYKEGAIRSPVPRTDRVDIAAWIANTALNSVLEASTSHGKHSLSVLDRGLFDALAFIQLLRLDGSVGQGECAAMAQYFSSTLWTKRVDIVYFLDITPDLALSRDVATMVGSPPGLITNLRTLQLLSEAYRLTNAECFGRFGKVRVIDARTDGIEPLARVIVGEVERRLYLQADKLVG